jgi:hypothetical protein
MRREAIKRVGGTLMVTRALGDGYLKVPVSLSLSLSLHLSLSLSPQGVCASLSLPPQGVCVCVTLSLSLALPGLLIQSVV